MNSHQTISDALYDQFLFLAAGAGISAGRLPLDLIRCVCNALAGQILAHRIHARDRAAGRAFLLWMSRVVLIPFERTLLRANRQQPESFAPLLRNFARYAAELAGFGFNGERDAEFQEQIEVAIATQNGALLATHLITWCEVNRSWIRWAGRVISFLWLF